MSYVDFSAELSRARKMVQDCCNQMNMPGLHITVSWNNRFTRRMGDAETKYGKKPGQQVGGAIRLSRPLWPNATPEQRDQTIKHEAAHIIANIKHGVQCGHGPRWKAVMRSLGLEPKRCHQVDRTGLKRSQPRMVIPCKGCRKPITFTKRLLTNWVKKRQKRNCLTCKTVMTAEYAQANVEFTD